MDIWRSSLASKPPKLLGRYSKMPHGSPIGRLQKLAIKLAAGSIISCLGRRAKDLIGGIYTYGILGGKARSINGPQYNAFWPLCHHLELGCLFHLAQSPSPRH